MTKLLLAAAVLPLLAACATAAEMTPQHDAALGTVCTKVIGLTHSPAEFDGCVDSLSGALARQTAYAHTAGAYRDCARQGVAQNTPDFGRCVLDDRARAAPSAAAIDASSITTPDGFSGGYFSSSFRQRYARAEYACAAIGLQPGSGSFESCAHDLDSNMWLIEHPPG
jgi:hypothetical protein